MEKVVLVTGAAKGIGAAIAEEFASRGDHVIINYNTSKEEALNLKKELESTYGIKALPIKADVTNEEEVKEMVEKIIQTFGHVDVLVNNAGIAIDKEFKDRTVEDFKLTLNTNLIGPFIVSKYVGLKMLENSSGKIINISSTNGIDTNFPTSIDYDASKAGLISLTHNLAIEFSPYVNVNCVAPGWVNTDMNKSLPKKLIAEETAKIYKQRFAEPKEIAKVVAFLGSDDSEYINDEVIKVDGGY